MWNRTKKKSFFLLHFCCFAKRSLLSMMWIFNGAWLSFQPITPFAFHSSSNSSTGHTVDRAAILWTAVGRNADRQAREAGRHVALHNQHVFQNSSTLHGTSTLPGWWLKKRNVFFSQMRNVMFPLLFCWECALCLALSPFCVPVLAQHHSLRMVVENGCQMRNVMFSLLFCGACSLCLSSSRPVCPGQFLCAVLNVMEKSRRCVCGRGRII